MKTPSPVVDLGFKVLNLVHRTIFQASGSRIGGSAFGMPIVELRTIGRKSGLVRTVMLTAPVVRGEVIVLVASKGGDDRHPLWFQNLVAQPDIEVTIGRVRKIMRARVANSAEAADLWPDVIASYRPYATYRRRAHRDIPLVICEPR